VKALPLVILATSLSAGSVSAKDGHAVRPAATAPSSAYKSPAKTYYSYTPPRVYSTPKSAYAPVSSSTTTASTGTLKDTYRRITTDRRMSKEWTAKVDQSVNQGIGSAKSWINKVKSAK
jgi:hypothetical protein